MSYGFTKLYSDVVNSSVWKLPSDERIVWITMLALKDRDGRVIGSLEWLADMARVPDEACRRAVKKLLAPDPRSRSLEHEGRRISRIDGGWYVLNHFRYRDGEETIREYQRRKQAEYRQRKRREAMEAMQNKSTPLPGEREAVNAMERGDEEEADRIAAQGLPGDQ
jgi:hypothetical protein